MNSEPQTQATPASPRVSVILPVYNAAGTITAALESIRSQSFGDFETIVIDDGSADDSAARVEAFVQTDGRFRLVRNPQNLGLQKTLNLGISLARGEYLARLDADDTWASEDKLAQQVQFLDDHVDHTVVGTAVIIVDEGGQEITRYLKPLTDSEIRRTLLQRCCFIHGSVLMRASAVRAVGGYDESEVVHHAEDYDLWYRLGQSGKLANLPLYGIRYMVSDHQISARHKHEQARKNLQMMRKYRHAYPGFVRAWLRYRVLQCLEMLGVLNWLVQRRKTVGSVGRRAMFVIFNFETGDAIARIEARFAGHMAATGWQCEVIALGPRPSSAQEVADGVKIKFLGQGHAAKSLIQLAKEIVAFSPDVIYSAQIHVNNVTLVANVLAGGRSRLLVSEHINLAAELARERGRRKFKVLVSIWLATGLYRLASRVLFVSSGTMVSGTSTLRLPSRLAVTLYNPVIDGNLLSGAKKPVRHRWLGEDTLQTVLWVGRLHQQKGLGDLISAFAMVSRNLPQARLIMVGTGPDEHLVRNQVKHLGLTEVVDLVGFDQNPYRYMSKAGVFVLSSWWEGLPTVLIEAMACGLPVVSTRCPSGPEEIITDGLNGILVPVHDPAALAMATERILTDAKLAANLASAGRIRANDFTVEGIGGKFAELADTVLTERL